MLEAKVHREHSLTDTTLTYTLKRSSKWPLFNFIFSDLVLLLLKWIFAQICAFQWSNVKRCFNRVFYHFTIFGFKMQKQSLKKIRVLGHFFELKYRWSSGLEKTPNPWIFAYEWFFMITLFSTFSDIFENNQLHILISLYAFYFMWTC